MRISTAELPTIQAASAHELGLNLARNALASPVRTEAGDNAARAICWSIIRGIEDLDRPAEPHFLFREDFYMRSSTGKQILNGAVVYRQALLDILGGHLTTSRRPVREQTVVHPEDQTPYRHWEWYGAGLLRVSGLNEIIVLEGKAQRWQTSPRVGWVDYFQFGALARVSRPDTIGKTLRSINVSVFDTPDFLPTDKVHTGNFGKDTE